MNLRQEIVQTQTPPRMRGLKKTIQLYNKSEKQAAANAARGIVVVEKHFAFVRINNFINNVLAKKCLKLNVLI